MSVRAGRVPFDLDDDRLARAAWSRLAEPDDHLAHRLVAVDGPSGALRRVVDADPATRDAQVRLPDLDPAREMLGFTRLGGRFVVPGDAEWPGGLDDLCELAPFGLWVRGPVRLSDTLGRSVSVVGARASTAYGDHVAGELASAVCDRRTTVVSGAAYGIDGAAHRGALAAGGDTIAVLAGGADRAYPLGHDALISRIAERGAVASEVPPGSAPTRGRFLARNRMIGALTRGTVVVEAAVRSGALSTARWANDLLRVVAAVPGPVTSAMSAGCHALLREGAVCVTTGDEVVEAVGAMGADLAAPRVAPARPHDDLDPVLLRVLDSVPLRRGATARSVSTVAGLTSARTRRALDELDRLGLVSRRGVAWTRAGTP